MKGRKRELMFYRYKLTLLAAAAALAMSLTACRGGETGSQTSTPKSTVKPPVEADVSVADSSEAEPVENHIGQYLAAANEILSGDKYTYKCTLTADGLTEPVTIERYKSGSRLYQSQQTSTGKRGFLTDGEKVYEFDYLTYSYTDEGTVLPDVIESVVKENLPQTSTHIAAKEGETAEVFIARMVYERGKKEQMRVVTSDGLIQTLTLGHGALRTSSREFLKELEAIEEAIREALQG